MAVSFCEKKQKNDFLFDFYFDRLRRIVPAYLVMLAAVTFLAAVLFTPKDFNHYWASAKSAMFFASNAYFSGFGNYFAPSGHELPLLHTCSLAIEMQFYSYTSTLLAFVPEKITQADDRHSDSGADLVWGVFDRRGWQEGSVFFYYWFARQSFSLVFFWQQWRATLDGVIA